MLFLHFAYCLVTCHLRVICCILNTNTDTGIPLRMPCHSTQSIVEPWFGFMRATFWSRAGLENMWWIWKCQVYAGASFNEFKENWPEKGWSSCFEDGASCFKLYRPSPGCAIRCEKTAVLLAWWRPSPCLSWPFHTKDKGGREEAPRVAERTLRALWRGFLQHSGIKWWRSGILSKNKIIFFLNIAHGCPSYWTHALADSLTTQSWKDAVMSLANLIWWRS